MASAKRPVEALQTAVTSESLLTRVVDILDRARTQVVREVNSQMVLAYWLIGREIVEALQQGQNRAGYGQEMLQDLSIRLTKRYGKGFSSTNLKYFRLFYQAYSNRAPEIRHEPRDESRSRDSLEITEDLLSQLDQRSEQNGFSSLLSWTHYRTLCSIEHVAERMFYEIEAERNRWSQPELQRQISSHLFLRLVKSRDKQAVLKLALDGQIVEQPTDVIKHPYVLDFLGLPEDASLHETQLEQAIVDKIQPFLLELGKGFAFVARQQRISTDSSHFYIDLVFYNYLLKCFVLVDLKMGKLTHQDVGQMDMYVRMYDDLQRSEGDNPTVGLILCAEHDDVVVRYSVLHESKQLFASRYMLVLPTEEELRSQLLKSQSMLTMRRREDE